MYTNSVFRYGMPYSVSILLKEDGILENICSIGAWTLP